MSTANAQAPESLFSAQAMDLEPVRLAMLRSDAASLLDEVLALSPTDRCKLVVKVLTDCAADPVIKECLRSSTLPGVLKAEYARRSQLAAGNPDSARASLLAPVAVSHSTGQVAV